MVKHRLTINGTLLSMYMTKHTESSIAAQPENASITLDLMEIKQKSIYIVLLIRL